MPYRRLPNSMPAVLRTMKKACETYRITPVVADRAISAAIFAQIDDSVPTSLYSRVFKECNDVELAQAAQAPLTTEMAQAAARLTMFVSHFHQVLDLGILRGTFAAGARSYYGRDIHATALPDLSTYDLVKEEADKIVAGEAAREAAEVGTYRAMDLPNAAEIGEQRDHFVDVRTGELQALANTDTQQGEAQALYDEAHTLAVDICDTVEFFYRKDLDDASRRAKCMRWGVVYIYDDGTAVPPPPTPAGP